MDLCRLPLLLVACVALGCTTVAPEPESAYERLPPQSYPFTTVWECSLEAVQGQGFTIESSEKQAERGHFATHMKPSNKDKITGAEEAQRVRVRIEPSGKDVYDVQVAASVFERTAETGDKWSYKAGSPQLVAAIRDGLQASLRRRYK